MNQLLCRLQEQQKQLYIFQGEDDANIPISDLDKIREDFKKWGKSNLHIFTFPKHDHDLNYLQYIFTGVIPDGLQCVFDIAYLFCKSKSQFESEKIL